jgi:DNA polymerase-3 subunit gamma/tau
MAYLALARKWRPRTFADVIGQPHIVRALANALDSGRVHHAFLFTGTRGVGKTTIARILVKALNCERGVSAQPCGECGACTTIDAGRFVDFLEIDAASRTGVDDTRDLLDNVQYTPAAGRYKVYLIDEVHMLSKQAFNALLKTLEEPPPHVKFLLATTDPQKIPVTVLSRCLQFNLKRLSPAQITERLATIAAAEDLAAEPAALDRLARAAAGSMRDALSLTDQALAYGGGALRDRDVATMLGSLDRAQTVQLVSAIAAGDAAALLATVRGLDELAPDYGDALAQVATLLQQVAVVQLAGAGALDADAEAAGVPALAASLDAESVQLWYQIAILGRRDLPHAPDPRTGFEMTLLRMLAFRPGADGGDPAVAPAATARPAAGRAPAASAAGVGVPAAGPAGPVSSGATIGDWPAFVATLGLDAAARQLAANAALESATASDVRLVVLRQNAHLMTDNLQRRVTTALQERLGAGVKVHFAVRDQATGGTDTAASREAREAEAELARARAAIEADPNVRQLAEQFGARVVPGSVRATRPSKESGR